MIERTRPKLSLGAQCRLLSIARSSFHYAPQGETAMNLDLMLKVDKPFLDTPFHGVRQMTWHLQNEGHAVKGRGLENVFIERPWRSPKHDCVDPHAGETGSQAKAGIGCWITFRNHHRPHTAHGGQPPAVVYFNSIETDRQGQAVA